MEDSSMLKQETRQFMEVVKESKKMYKENVLNKKPEKYYSSN